MTVIANTYHQVVPRYIGPEVSSSVFFLNRRAFLSIRVMFYGLLGAAIVVGVGGSIVYYLLFDMIGTPILAVFIAFAMMGALRHHVMTDFCRMAGKELMVSVCDGGIKIAGKLRWSWDDVLFCSPGPGDTSFDLLTESREAYFFVCATKSHSDETFERLKGGIRERLKFLKPSALDPD